MKYLVFLLAVFSFSSEANLSRSSITRMGTGIYGLYTSSDPLCASGFVATLPLQTTPRTVDLVNRPSFGSGRIAKRVACVALVMRNQVNVEWSSGNYAGSDAVCNSGGTVNPIICRDTGSGAVAVDWPSDISNEMTALGLTKTTSCTAGANGSEIVVVFLSTNSACTGNSVLDSATAGCGNANTFRAPTSVSDTARGVKLSVESGRGSYRLVIDPDLSVGGSGGSCQNVSPPKFALK